MVRPLKNSPMTAEELDLARSMLATRPKHGSGYRAIATAITERRVKGLRSPEARRDKAVSDHWVRRELDRLNRDKTHTVTKPGSARESPKPRRNADDAGETVDRPSSPPGRSETPGENRASPESGNAALAGDGPDSERGE